jgi:hypothetical protein
MDVHGSLGTGRPRARIERISELWEELSMVFPAG